MIQGEKTKIYTDVKIPVYAGMQFNTSNYKMKKIGYDTFRHYFDTKEKDCQVGSERIKRTLKY
jgi:hypothetical protein